MAIPLCTKCNQEVIPPNLVYCGNCRRLNDGYRNILIDYLNRHKISAADVPDDEQLVLKRKFEVWLWREGFADHLKGNEAPIL